MIVKKNVRQPHILVSVPFFFFFFFLFPLLLLFSSFTHTICSCDRKREEEEEGKREREREKSTIFASFFVPLGCQFSLPILPSASFIYFFFTFEARDLVCLRRTSSFR